MPIWDNNGTTSYEIGKLYDHNGTSATQTGNIYDNNGTTSSLIYSADEQIFPNGYTISTEKNTTQSSLTNVGAFYANTSNSSGGAGRAYVAFNATGWDTLTVNWSYECGTYTTGVIGIMKSLPVQANGFNWWLDPPIETATQQAFIFKGNQVKKNQTTTANISSLSGTYYLYLSVYSGSSVDAYASASITSAVLS